MGNNSVPKFIFRFSRFPVYRGSVLGRFYCMRMSRPRSTAARLLWSWVRIPPGEWMFLCCECCVLSGRGLCDELITRPEESNRLWCVVVCDLGKQTSWMRRSRPTRGLSRQEKMNMKMSRTESCLFYEFNTGKCWGVRKAMAVVWLTIRRRSPAIF